MTRSVLVLALLSALVLSGPAFALRHIIVGNEPLKTGFGGKEVLDALNVEERVLLSEHDGDLTIYYKGGPTALNRAFKHLVALPTTKHEIILLPVPAPEMTFDKKKYPYDWVLYIPTDDSPRRGRRPPARVETKATLTVYIPEPLPAAPADPARAKQWIADLARDDFKVRELAAKELRAMGTPVAGLIREALKTKPSAEARDRLEKILAELSREIRVDVLELPAGVPLVCLDDFLAQARKQLADKDPVNRGHGAFALAEHDPPVDEILAELEKVLKTETDANPLAGAMWAANRLRAGAKPLLPAMRAAVPKVDKSLAASFQQVIDGIEVAQADPIPKADAKKRATIRKEIKEFVAGRREAGAK